MKTSFSAPERRKSMLADACFTFNSLVFAFALGMGWIIFLIYAITEDSSKPKRIQTAKGITTVEPKVIDAEFAEIPTKYLQSAKSQAFVGQGTTMEVRNERTQQ